MLANLEAFIFLKATCKSTIVIGLKLKVSLSSSALKKKITRNCRQGKHQYKKKTYTGSAFCKRLAHSRTRYNAPIRHNSCKSDPENPSVSRANASYCIASVVSFSRISFKIAHLCSLSLRKKSLGCGNSV